MISNNCKTKSIINSLEKQRFDISFNSLSKKQRKKEGKEREYKELNEGDDDDYREGEHEEEPVDDMFRDDEEFGNKDDDEDAFRAGKEKVEQKEDSFDIFGDDE